MTEAITILHTPGCPNVGLVRGRLAEALARMGGPSPSVALEEVADPGEAERRGFHGSPAILVEGVDIFAGPESPPGFACRTYRVEAGLEGAPSVDQIVTALSTRRGH